MTKVALNLFSEDVGHSNLEFFENKNDSGVSAFYIEGIFAQADLVNGNGRNYPEDVLFPAAEAYIETRIKRGIALGELDHPEGLTVALQNVSHLITEMRFDGKNIYGKAKITDTPMGNTAKGLATSGVNLGVSTRGGGKSKVHKDGIEYMEMYIMTAVDIVSNPSAPDAMVRAFAENTEFFVEEGIITKSTASKLRKVDQLSTSEFRKLIRNITKF